MTEVFVLWVFFFSHNNDTSSQQTIGPFKTVVACQSAAKLINQAADRNSSRIQMACIPVSSGVMPVTSTAPSVKPPTASAPSGLLKRDELDRVKICKEFAEDTYERLATKVTLVGYQRNQIVSLINDQCWELESHTFVLKGTP